MEAVEIPISSDAPYFSQENQLFSHTYTLEFEWIERGQFWVMHLYDEVEQAIALGIKLMVDWPLFVLRRGESVTEFFLLAKTPNAQLNLKTLHSDFILVAHALV
jgi:hypothetical protein